VSCRDRAIGALYRKINNQVSGILAKHTGHSVEKVKRDLNRPRYFSPEDAVDYGLIDRVLESEDKQVSEALRSISKGNYEWNLTGDKEDQVVVNP